MTCVFLRVSRVTSPVKSRVSWFTSPSQVSSQLFTSPSQVPTSQLFTSPSQVSVSCSQSKSSLESALHESKSSLESAVHESKSSPESLFMRLKCDSSPSLWLEFPSLTWPDLLFVSKMRRYEYQESWRLSCSACLIHTRSQRELSRRNFWRAGKLSWIKSRNVFTDETWRQ